MREKEMAGRRLLISLSAVCISMSLIAGPLTRRIPDKLGGTTSAPAGGKSTK